MEGRSVKYTEVLDWIRERIADGEWKPGDRIESEPQLCARFQVSRQTVRRAIAVLQKEGAVERIRGSGTYVSRGEEPKSGRRRTMQVAVMTTYVREYIFTAILQEIERELSQAGYGMQVSFTNNTVEKERMLLRNILEKNQVDGLIAEPTMSGLPNPNLELYRKIMEKGIPVLFINSHYPELDAPYVSLDDYRAGRMVTRHLLECGHRRIAAIFKADDGQGHRRYAGYLRELMDADINLRSRQVIWLDTEGVRSMREEAGWILRRLQNCTACVCYNDEVASSLTAICLEQGIRVPEDLSIIGIDDSEMAVHCEVPLTSARNPVRQLGRAAVLEMMQLMNGERITDRLELEPEIVNRSSVRIIDELAGNQREII